MLLPRAIGAGAVEVDENVARFSAFAGADDAAVFEFVHDAGGAAIAEAEASLQERDAGFLFAANDLDALLNNFLVFVAAAFAIETAGWLGELLMDFHFVTRFALFGDPIDYVLNLLVGDERALGANQFGRAGR